MLTRNNSDSEIHLREHIVNETWLKLILVEYYSKEKPDVKVKVTSFTVAKGSETLESVHSDIIALSIDSEIDEERKSFDLVVKLLPDDPFSRYFVAEAEFDMREIKFYTEVVPDLEELQSRKLIKDASPIRLPIPKCYLGKYVPFAFSDTPPSTPDKINESIIVMEDLKKQGYCNVNFENGLTLDQVKSAFESVSRLHALSLAMKMQEKKSLLEKYDFLFQTEKASASYQQLMERRLPQLTLFLESKMDMKAVVDCLNLIKPKTKHLIEVLLRPREPIALITHTDFWSNNLLFGGDQCAILDWQMVTYSQPTNDLALLMISSLPSEIRRQYTTHLLDFYWQHFIDNTKKLNVEVERDLKYTKKELMEDYKNSQLLALLLCIGSIDVALKNSEIEKRLIDVLSDLHKDGVLSFEFVNGL